MKTILILSNNIGKRVKIIFFILFLLLFAQSLCAQDVPSALSLPKDTTIHIGTLPNGLTYFVKRNTNPEHRVHYYLVQKVGSILEEDNQLGLAHFLEHMAFNGTKNFPKKKIIEYLQSIGCKMGADLNAFTSFDETVFTIKDAPTQKQADIDSCLLILHDWSGFITLDPKEIDAERPVVHEEWRTQEGSYKNIYEQTLLQVLPDNKYSKRMPIGSMDIVDHFDPQVLRDFYHKWYRPDLQAVIVVGDIDPESIIQKIKEIFRDIPKPINPAKREYVRIKDNEEPLIAIATHPEASMESVDLCFKIKNSSSDNSEMSSYMRQMLTDLVRIMIRNRLSEYRLDQKSPMISSSVSYGLFMDIASTKNAFTLSATVKKGRIVDALKLLITEVERAKKFGFSLAELERAKDSYILYYKNVYGERAKLSNQYYADACSRYFRDKGYLINIEDEYKLNKFILKLISAFVINDFVSDFFTGDNVCIMISGPQKNSIKYPSKEQVMDIYKKLIGAKVEKYEYSAEDQKTLLDKLPKPGRIVSSKQDKGLNVIEMTLSNGVKVYLKKTDFTDDTIRLRLKKKGGLSLYGEKDFSNLKFLNQALNVSGLGKHNQIELQRILSGSSANLDIDFELHDVSMEGISSINDFETLLQLLYLNCTNLRKDKKAFKAYIDRREDVLKSSEGDIQSAINDSITPFLFDSPRARFQSVFDVNNADYGRIMTINKEQLGNMEGAQIFIVGNIDIDKISPLIESYLASLPVDKNNPNTTDERVTLPMRGGRHQKIIEWETSIPIAYVMNVMPFDMKQTTKNSIMLNLTESILKQMYTEKIREEIGGAYTVFVTSGNLDEVEDKAAINVFFPTDPDKMQEMNDIVYSVIENLAKSGPKKEYFNYAVEHLKKSYPERLKTNSFWLDRMVEKYWKGDRSEESFIQILDSIRPEDIHNFVKEIIRQDNRLNIIIKNKSE